MNLINLLPHRQWAARRRRQRWRSGLGWSVALALLMAATGAMVLDGRLTRQIGHNHGLQLRLSSLQAEEAQSGWLKGSEAAPIPPRRSALDTPPPAHPLALDIIRGLARLTPPQLALTDVQLDDRVLTIRGVAAAYEPVFTLLAALHQASTPALHEAELLELHSAPAGASLRALDHGPGPSVQRPADDAPRLGFTLRALVRPVPPGAQEQP